METPCQKKTAIGAALSDLLDIQAPSHWKGSLWLDISAHRPILHTYDTLHTTSGRWVGAVARLQRYVLSVYVHVQYSTGTIRIHM